MSHDRGTVCGLATSFYPVEGTSCLLQRQQHTFREENASYRGVVSFLPVIYAAFSRSVSPFLVARTYPVVAHPTLLS